MILVIKKKGILMIMDKLCIRKVDINMGIVIVIIMVLMGILLIYIEIIDIDIIN